ncbi:MAG: hypothetical protein ACHBN1_03025 [Heteroscytonema crispum UTEX LB 1556]
MNGPPRRPRRGLLKGRKWRGNHGSSLLSAKPPNGLPDFDRAGEPPTTTLRENQYKGGKPSRSTRFTNNQPTLNFLIRN